MFSLHLETEANAQAGVITTLFGSAAFMNVFISSPNKQPAKKVTQKAPRVSMSHSINSLFLFVFHNLLRIYKPFHSSE